MLKESDITFLHTRILSLEKQKPHQYIPLLAVKKKGKNQSSKKQQQQRSAAKEFACALSTSLSGGRNTTLRILFSYAAYDALSSSPNIYIQTSFRLVQRSTVQPRPVVSLAKRGIAISIYWIWILIDFSAASVLLYAY